MTETFFYNSPIGALQITGDEETLQTVLFVSSKKNGVAENNALTYSTPVSAVLKKCVTQLDNYFAGINLFFNVPLQQQGTYFQQEVWSQLIKIKPGVTISYLQLSKNLGNVKAIRAVGTANSKNNIAIIVPCHRVIGSNGDMVGYAGDIWRKKWLLQHEAKYLNGVQTLF